MLFAIAEGQHFAEGGGIWLVRICQLLQSNPQVAEAYYKTIGRVTESSVTGIENPEPAWLRRKLPVNNWLQNSVMLYVTVHKGHSEERSTKPQPTTTAIQVTPLGRCPVRAFWSKVRSL